MKNQYKVDFYQTVYLGSQLVEAEDKKQAIKEAKAKKLKKQQEIMEYIRYGLITLVTIAFIGVAIGITVKFIVNWGVMPSFAHNVIDDGTCKLYDQKKYFLICMNEGIAFADTELYLDYKKNRGNWIEIDEEE